MDITGTDRDPLTSCAARNLSPALGLLSHPRPTLSMDRRRCFHQLHCLRESTSQAPLEASMGLQNLPQINHRLEVKALKQDFLLKYGWKIFANQAQ